MNRLTSEQRARVLHLLCEGNSIRATVRLTGASKSTIAKLLVTAGKACMAYQGDYPELDSPAVRAWIPLSIRRRG
jgi:uncharacterized protein YerC